MLYNVLVSAMQHESAISIYIHPLPLEPPLTPPPTPLGCHRALGRAPCVIHNFPLAIYFTYVSIYVSMLLFLLVLPFPSYPPCRVRKSVLYVCISIAALQISSSVLSF